MNTLFTIGHSAHTIDSFISLIQEHAIQVIADVRSKPYSGRFPWFSRQPLEHSLKAIGIKYVFLGRELGARRCEKECYDEGKATYERIAATPVFHEGLDRLRKGIRQYRIALLCAEKDPLDCHRTILVARYATKFSNIKHILGDGSIEPHKAAEDRLLRRYQLGSSDLFRNRNELLLEAYARRGREISYTELESVSNLP